MTFLIFIALKIPQGKKNSKIFDVSFADILITILHPTRFANKKHLTRGVCTHGITLLTLLNSGLCTKGV